MTTNADELLSKMADHPVPMAPDRPERTSDLPRGLCDELVADVMATYGFTRAEAIQGLKNTGHF